MKILAHLLLLLGFAGCAISSVPPLAYDEQNGIDSEGIRQTVVAHRPQALECYNEALKNTPDLSGKVVLVWTLNKEGAVTESRIKENTTGSEAFGSCLTDVSKNWAFPKLAKSDTVTVIYPLAFKREIK
jgi:hypothetical protein